MSWHSAFQSILVPNADDPLRVPCHCLLPRLLIRGDAARGRLAPCGPAHVTILGSYRRRLRATPRHDRSLLGVLVVSGGCVESPSIPTGSGKPRHDLLQRLHDHAGESLLSFELAGVLLLCPSQVLPGNPLLGAGHQRCFYFRPPTAVVSSLALAPSSRSSFRRGRGGVLKWTSSRRSRHRPHDIPLHFRRSRCVPTRPARTVSALPNKRLQLTLNSSLQSIRGSVLAAGVCAPALAVSAVGAAEPHVRYTAGAAIEPQRRPSHAC